MSVLLQNEDTLRYLADRLVELGDSVPTEIDGFRLDEAQNPLEDPDLFDVANYPADIWAEPGQKKPNRAGFARWGSWVNSLSLKRYGRPLFLVTSADLAGSTNISGFGDDYSDELTNTGWYERDTNPEGVVLPQPITEFANAGIMAGAASVNLSADPENDFNGWYTACSTYGAFSYLKYGMMRLYSQLAQDCELQLGKTLWVAGHSGPRRPRTAAPTSASSRRASPSSSPRATSSTWCPTSTTRWAPCWPRPCAAPSPSWCCT